MAGLDFIDMMAMVVGLLMLIFLISPTIFCIAAGMLVVAKGPTLHHRAIALAAVLLVVGLGLIIMLPVPGNMWPIEFFIFGAALSPVFVAICVFSYISKRRADAARRITPDACRQCGYDLRGFAKDHPCPECGHPKEREGLPNAI